MEVDMRASLVSSAAAVTAFGVLTGCSAADAGAPDRRPAAVTASMPPGAPGSVVPPPAAPGVPPSGPSPAAAQLPQGGRTIFPAYRVVAYYGTAGNKAL